MPIVLFYDQFYTARNKRGTEKGDIVRICIHLKLGPPNFNQAILCFYDKRMFFILGHIKEEVPFHPDFTAFPLKNLRIINGRISIQPYFRIIGKKDLLDLSIPGPANDFRCCHPFNCRLEP